MLIKEKKCFSPSWLGHSSEYFKNYWNLVYSKQSVRTRRIHDYLLDLGWDFRTSIYEPHSDAKLPQDLSRAFLTYVIRPDTYHEEAARPPEDVFCDWLISAYEALLILKNVKPGSATCKVAKAILNNKAPFEHKRAAEWKPVYMNEAGEIVFAEVSRVKLQENNGRIDVHDQPAPFPYNTVLSEGFKKILCAFEQARDMQTLMEARNFHQVDNFYLADKERPIIDIIRSIHRANSQTLATGEQIATFDFKTNVLDFIFRQKPLRRDIM